MAAFEEGLTSSTHTLLPVFLSQTSLEWSESPTGEFESTE